MYKLTYRYMYDIFLIYISYIYIHILVECVYSFRLFILLINLNIHLLPALPPASQPAALTVVLRLYTPSARRSGGVGYSRACAGTLVRFICVLQLEPTHYHSLIRTHTCNALSWTNCVIVVVYLS